jgi:hypothetical protein
LSDDLFIRFLTHGQFGVFADKWNSEGGSRGKQKNQTCKEKE